MAADALTALAVTVTRLTKLIIGRLETTKAQKTKEEVFVGVTWQNIGSKNCKRRVCTHRIPPLCRLHASGRARIAARLGNDLLSRIDVYTTEIPNDYKSLRGNWVADMQVLRSEMHKGCSRWKVFASRTAKPAPVSRPFLHLGSRNLNVEPPFSPVGRTVYYLTMYYFMSIRFQAEVFASRETCMSNHHFDRSAGPFTVLLFCYFISIRFQAEVFASRVAKPECRTTIYTGRQDRLLFYYFPFHFHSVPGRDFCISRRET